jgi:transcriptional regulator with XRE-family HTH domain
MKRHDMNEILNDHSTDLMLNNLTSVPQIRFISKVDEALEARGLSQAKLAVLCGLRPNTISDIINGKRMSLTKSHIASVMVALRITDIREILDIELAPETIEKFDTERKNWIENKVIPQEIATLYTKNAESFFNTDINA